MLFLFRLLKTIFRGLVQFFEHYVAVLDTVPRYDEPLYNEPLYNEPLYNGVPGIRNDILQSINSKLYGKETPL